MNDDASIHIESDPGIPFSSGSKRKRGLVHRIASIFLIMVSPALSQAEQPWDPIDGGRLLYPLPPASLSSITGTDRCKSRVTRIQARMYLQSASRKKDRTCSGDSFNEWKAVLRLARICAFVLLTC